MLLVSSGGSPDESRYGSRASSLLPVLLRSLWCLIRLLVSEILRTASDGAPLLWDIVLLFPSDEGNGSPRSCP